jgi:hypothetical protein
VKRLWRKTPIIKLHAFVFKCFGQRVLVAFGRHVMPVNHRPQRVQPKKDIKDEITDDGYCAEGDAEGTEPDEDADGDAEGTEPDGDEDLESDGV